MACLIPLVDYPIHLIVAVPIGDNIEETVILEWHSHEEVGHLLQSSNPRNNHITQLPTATGVYACRATLYIEATKSQSGESCNADTTLSPRELLKRASSLPREIRIEESRPLWLPNGARLVSGADLMHDIPFSVAWA